MQVPLREQAGGGTAEAVTATVRQFLACLNAGDLARTASVLTDDGLRGLLGSGATVAQGVDARPAAAPTPLDEPARKRLIAVTNVTKLRGEAVAAFVVYNDPANNPPAGPETLLVTFVPSGEGQRFLIDDFVVFTEVAGSAGTPPALP